MSKFIKTFIFFLLIAAVAGYIKVKNSQDIKHILHYCYQKNDSSKECTFYKTLFGWSYKDK